MGISALAMSVGAERPSAENVYGRAKLGGKIVWKSLLRGEGLDGWEVNGDPWTPSAWSRSDRQPN
jgi:hypothetical protein